MLSAECWLLQAKSFKGSQVLLLQVACQKRKPRIDGSFCSVLRILGQEIHCICSTKGSDKLMARLYDYTRDDKSLVLIAEYSVLIADC